MELPLAPGSAGPSWLRQRFASPPSRVWLLTGILLGSALVVDLGPFSVLGVAPVRAVTPWWLLAVTFIATERFLVDLEFRRHNHSYSLFEIPLVIGFFLASPAAVLAAQLVSMCASLLHRRDPLKSAFNFATGTLSAGVAVLAFHSLAGSGGPTSVRNWLAAIVATLLASTLESSSVTLAMLLATGELPRGGMRQSLEFGLLVSVTNTSLALVATTIIWFDGKAAALLIVPTVVLFFAYRAYLWQRRKSDSLESLHESTRTLHHAVDSEPATRDLLEQVRAMFRSETAEFLLFAGSDGAGHVRITLSGEDHLEVARLTGLDPNEGVWARVASEDRALLVSRPIRDRRLAELLGHRGLRDAMVAPLRDDQGVVGTLTVGNRIGQTFRRDDLPLFETLANHASVSLANARLMDKLRDEAMAKEHQALHDALTGLPNRTSFHSSVEASVRSLREGASLAVLLMDLDRFKEVNDTLGHHNGDVLLQEVARRLRERLGSHDTVARLSGDEFAVLLTRVATPEEALGAAARLRRELGRPFTLAGVEVDIGASFGVALYPQDGDDANTLLQRADVAMYVAKETHSGEELYRPDRDGYSPTRLALASELRQAIENHELVVHYQPKVDIGSGRVTGAEALVRWIHPSRGFMAPDEFIPLAEHTGLVRPLTTFVLRTALRQCRVWTEQGSLLTVSVNLSVRSLLDEELPQSVASLLAEFGVEPARLILEITESSFMADPARAADVVHRLSALGVGLSIDDFGTGYSSLSYLKRLPVTEIKIDKSFVMSMMDQDNDAVIVRSTVDLGRNLGLRVVAEGVETEDMWFRLENLGCDVAQGYFVSRPLPAAGLSRWLTDWNPPRASGSARRGAQVVKLAAG